MFDPHEPRFSDGALDIVWQSGSYLDTERELAAAFIDSYIKQLAEGDRIEGLLPLYVVNDRMKLLEFFTRSDVRASTRDGKSSWGGAERYVDLVLTLQR